MRFTKKYQEAVETTWDNYTQLLNIELRDYKDALIKTMKEHKQYKSFSRGEVDFRDFAIEGFLRKVKMCHDEYLDMLNAVKVTRDIADGFEDDTEIV